MPEETETETETYDVRVIISSLGSERRNIQFKDMTKDQSQELIQTVNSAFDTVRRGSSLLLTGSDGIVVFANLDNVVFIEVQIAQ